MTTVPPVATVRPLASRYEFIELLRRGRGIDTFLACDRVTGREVIVKTAAADSVSSVAHMRLEHEAEVLRDVGNAGSRPLLDFGRDGEVLYLVMPKIHGVTLEAVLTERALSSREALTVGIHILQSLCAAHARGVLHRDVKPANVIVDGGSPLSRATLIDYGLARSGRLDVSIRDYPVGTAQYVSPEQAGLLGDGVDERSDLYAFGVLLFRCLAGRLPFLGETVGEVLRQHLNVPAPRLRDLALVPRALEEAVQHLLRKDPQDRYQCAEAVLADLEEIALGLDGGAEDPPLVVGLHDRRRTVTEPAFVGREGDLSALRTALQTTSAAIPCLVTVEAESGGGKTRLLDEFARQAQHLGAWVLRGHGTDQTAQRPLQVLDGVATQVEAAMAEDEALAGALRDRLGDSAQAVCDALPRLAATLGRGGPTVLPEAFGEARTVQALTVFLDALADDDRPTVVILDDCQWADGLSLTLLSHWWRRRGADPHRAGRLLLVCAFRSEEVPDHHPLRGLEPARRLALPPFGPDDVHRLVVSMAGVLPPAAVDLVTRLSEGSPLMASAVLRGLVECGALVDGDAGWRLDPRAMAELSASRRAAVILVRRLEALGEHALRLLSVGAVLGKEFDVATAVTLAGHGHIEAVRGLDQARRRHMIWMDEISGRCTFVHDKVREALLERLSPAERAETHSAAAVHFESLPGDHVFELAYHFDAAGDVERALPHAIAAGRRARRQHALELAERHFQIARRGVAAQDTELRREIAEGLGDVMMLRGAYAPAAEQFAYARALAASDRQRAEIHGRLGELAFKRGDMRAAGDECEAALRYLGRHTPRRRVAFLVLLLWEVLVQLSHSLLPVGLVRRRSPEHAGDALLAARLHSRIAYTYWFRSGRVPCAWSHLRGMNLAERYHPTPELAQAYSEHAPVMTMVPAYGRGLAYVRRSLDIRTMLDDVWGQGQSLHFFGVVLYAATRYDECIERCREAVRLLERTGDRWEVNTARWHIAFALYRSGELQAAVEMGRRVYDAGVEIGDWQAAGISLGVWAKASEGRVPADLIARALERVGDDVHTRAELLQGEAVRLLRSGYPAEAAAVLESAWRLVRAAGLRQEYVAPVLPWLATALRAYAESLPVHAVAQRRALLRRARRTATRATRMARRYRNNLPHALREQGVIAVLSGRERRGRALLDASISVADAQQARYERALSGLARGRMGLAAGRPGGGEEIAAAERELAELTGGRDDGPTAEDRWIGLSLADRFDRVLGVGRRIASASSREAVFEAVHDAALDLLRGESCLMIDAVEDPSEELVVVSGSFDTGFSRTLASRAIGEGHPIVGSSDTTATSESIDLASVRSALYAPILVGGHATACFCVGHNQIDGLFGQEEVDLAEYIATLAGAALENVAGSEVRFRSLVQHSSDVITIVAEDGTVGYQSPSVERVFGYPPEGLQGRSLYEGLHQRDLPRMAAAVREAAAGAALAAPVECRWRHRDGSWRQTETFVNGLLDDPSVRGIVLNTRDVTERKRAEDALRAHVLRLADMAETDALTGLGNRRFFDRHLATAGPEPIAVLSIDLEAPA